MCLLQYFLFWARTRPWESQTHQQSICTNQFLLARIWCILKLPWTSLIASVPALVTLTSVLKNFLSLSSVTCMSPFKASVCAILKCVSWKLKTCLDQTFRVNRAYTAMEAKLSQCGCLFDMITPWYDQMIIRSNDNCFLLFCHCSNDVILSATMSNCFQ